MMEEKFLEFVAEVIDKDASELSMESSYSKGDWSSLMHLRLMVELCDEFDVDIPSSQLNNIDTLQDFYRYLEG